MKIAENLFDPFVKTFLTNQDKTEDVDKKIWENEFSFWVLHVKIRLRGSFHENLREKILTHFWRHFWPIETKMKMKMKKIWKNEFDFWIAHVKSRLYGNFYENRRKNFDPFFKTFFFSRHFWLTEAKMKTKMEKFGKINSIFEFSIWKVGYLELFLKICGKKIWPIFRTFLTNRGKNEVEDKKMWENEFEVFIKIWEKRSFLKFLPEKD